MDEIPIGFDTVEEAVYEVLQQTNNRPKEVFSLVYEKDGKFYYTTPKGSGNDFDGITTFKVPHGSIRYIAHNHPPGQGANSFSSTDIETANKFGVPSAIIYNGRIRTFTPGVSKVRTTYDRNTRSSDVRSMGEDFLWSPFPKMAEEMERDE